MIVVFQRFIGGYGRGLGVSQDDTEFQYYARCGLIDM